MPNLLAMRTGHVLLVDEPELSLHPQSQRRLHKFLSIRAADRQVIVSTHSVHFVDWDNIATGAKIYRANVTTGVGSTFHTLSQETIKSIAAIADSDWKNRRNYDTLAKEVFFARGCLLVEGYEDAHVLARFLQSDPGIEIEIFGYGSGGATGILAWLSACFELGIFAVGLFDGDKEGSTAFEAAKKTFANCKGIRVLQIPTPDIRDKHKLGDDCRTELEEIEKEGIFDNRCLKKKKKKFFLRAFFGKLRFFFGGKVLTPSINLPKTGVRAFPQKFL